MGDFSFTFSSDQFVSDGSQASAKFNLYLKSHELKQLLDTLREVMARPIEQRQTWVSDNREVIKSLLDDSLQDASMVMDGVYLDNEALKLSMELVTNLRDALLLLQSISQDMPTGTAN